MEENKKTAEQKFEERQGNNLLNFIIAKTYVRHSNMSEKEFLKEIGFEETDKTEDEAIRISKMNVYVETTNQLIKATNTVKQITAMLKIYLGDEKIVEEKGE